MDISPPPPFTAVLLAGGKSARMGRDKAGVLLDGEPLWQRQLGTLRATAPRELFISGKIDGPYAGAGLEFVLDAIPDRGPLAGLEAALRRASHPLVLILAIDLPAMTADFLASLVRAVAPSNTGCVTRAERWFQPLAAVYPCACLSLVEECLHGKDRSMQSFVRLAVEQGFMRVREHTPSLPDATPRYDRPRGGGRESKFLAALEAALPDYPLEASRRVLREYGNMSSPSVPLRAGGGPEKRKPDRNEDWWLVSFGAGFSARACRFGIG